MTTFDELIKIIRNENAKQIESASRHNAIVDRSILIDWETTIRVIRDAVEHLGIQADRVIRFIGKDGRDHSITLEWIQETFEIAQKTEASCPGDRGFAREVGMLPGRDSDDSWSEYLASGIKPLDRYFGNLPRDDIIKWSVVQESSFVTAAVCMYLGCRDIVAGKRLSSGEMLKKGFVNSHVVSPERLPGFIGWGYLETLHNEGWSVAVHNDYRQDGARHTFWLFTHPDGRYVKGEGETEHEALKQAYEQAAPVGGR